ncbi:MAG: hypothetical protein WD509_02420 [Candidatus Paceibacterota bacterium]
MEDQKLSLVQQAILRCLMRKFTSELPIPLAERYDNFSTNLSRFCSMAIKDTAAWDALPMLIQTKESDFSEVLNELEFIGGTVEGVHVSHTSFTKEALREELQRYLDHFTESVTLIEDEKDQSPVHSIFFA